MTERYWCSWVCPEDDPRPLSYPPNEKVLGWWCSGYDGEDRSILCATVAGSSETEVAEAIRADWPEFDGEFRFIQETDSAPPGDRFPLSDWMECRFTPPTQISDDSGGEG